MESNRHPHSHRARISDIPPRDDFPKAVSSRQILVLPIGKDFFVSYQRLFHLFVQTVVKHFDPLARRPIFGRGNMPVTITRRAEVETLVQEEAFGPTAGSEKPNSASHPSPQVSQEQALDAVPITTPIKRKKTGHTHPRPPLINLDQEGRLRVANMLAILNISHSTFYAGVKSGRYPPSDGKDGSFPYWKTSTARSFLAS